MRGIQFLGAISGRFSLLTLGRERLEDTNNYNDVITVRTWRILTTGTGTISVGTKGKEPGSLKVGGVLEAWCGGLDVSVVLVVLVWSPLLGGREEGGHQLGGVPVPRQGLAGSGYGEGQKGAASRGQMRLLQCTEGGIYL